MIYAGFVEKPKIEAKGSSLVEKSDDLTIDMNLSDLKMDLYIKNVSNKDTVSCRVQKTVEGYTVFFVKNGKFQKEKTYPTIDKLIKVLESAYYVKFNKKQIKLIEKLEDSLFLSENEEKLLEKVEWLLADSLLVDYLTGWLIGRIEGDKKRQATMENAVKREIAPLFKFEPASSLPTFWSNPFKFVGRVNISGPVTPSIKKKLEKLVIELVNDAVDETYVYYQAEREV